MDVLDRVLKEINPQFPDFNQSLSFQFLVIWSRAISKLGSHDELLRMNPKFTLFLIRNKKDFHSQNRQKM